MRTYIVGLLGVALALALVATACSKSEGGGTTESEGSGTTTLDGHKANDHGTKNVSGQSDVDLELDDFYFEPTVLDGSPGEQVTFKLENESDVEHNFSVTGAGVDQDVEAGQDAEVTVTFPDSGTLVFFCKYHQTRGMVGALKVS